MDIYDHVEHAGFATIESGDDLYIIREKADNQYEVFLGPVLLGTYVTIKEAVYKTQLGINKMTKVNEADKPRLSVEEWITTDEGLDFVAEIMYTQEMGSETLSRYDVGLMLRDFGILATGTYIDYFLSMLQEK